MGGCDGTGGIGPGGEPSLTGISGVIGGGGEETTAEAIDCESCVGGIRKCPAGSAG